VLTGSDLPSPSVAEYVGEYFGDEGDITGGEFFNEELSDDPLAEDPPEEVGEANGVGGRENRRLGWEGGGLGAGLSSSSSSEDGAGIGRFTGTWSEGLGAGRAIDLGLLGKEDSSKVTSVETLIVRVCLSQSLYPFELGSYPTKTSSEDCDSNLCFRFFLGIFIKALQPKMRR
jgi:hypothetical protein